MGLIYLDSCLLIYAIENDPVRGDQVRRAIAGEAADAFAISPLVQMECLVKPIGSADLGLQLRYENALTALFRLQLSESVFMLATQLRARLGLKTPDALHLACAQHYGCAALWTNDERLSKAACGLARNVCG